MSTPEVFVHAPDFHGEVASGRIEFDVDLTRYWASDKPEPYTEAFATTHLLQEPQMAEDPRIIFLQRALLFRLPQTREHAYTVLFRNDKEGYWRKQLEAAIEKPEKDFLDWAFIAKFGWVIHNALSDPAHIEVPEGLLQIYDSQTTLFTHSEGIERFLQHNSCERVGFRSNDYLFAAHIADQLNLTGEQLQWLRDRVATSLLQDFTRTREGRSVHRLYHDTAHCEGNSIDIKGLAFDEWVRELPIAIEQLSHGDQERRNALRALVIDKVIRDIRYELPRHEDIEFEGQFYDAYIREAIIRLLTEIGLSRDERLAVYNKIPYFVSYPEGETIVSRRGEDLLPIIEREFQLETNASERA